METWMRTRVGLTAVATAAMLTLGLEPAAAQATFNIALPAGDGVQGGVFVGGQALPPGGTPGIAGQVLFVEPIESQRVVEGAPYSAEIVTETTQPLADGNRISHRSSSRVTRDGRGRERREHEGTFFIRGLAAQNRQSLVTIMDPVADTAITLDAERQVATRLRLRARGAIALAAGGGGALSVQAAPAQPFDAAARVPAGALQWTAATAASPSIATFEPAASTGARTEALGTQMIEGVKAEGVRTTVTLPAGSIGNDLPIVIVSERWYSPELQTVLTSRRSDPRFGETVFRLVNLVRAEPPADLFEIPPGYQIEEPGPPVPPRPLR
jgi:hypothetical protein